MALPQNHRLKKPQAFSAVYRHGIKAVSRHLVVRVLSPADEVPTAEVESSVAVTLPPTQFGISVSQKVSKRAVDRNRLKRQVRSAIYQLLPRLKTGRQVVITVRPSAIECEYGEFLRELEKMFTELEVIDGHS